MPDDPKPTTVTVTHSFVPHRFVETETRCHCGDSKDACPAHAKQTVSATWLHDLGEEES